MLGLSERVRDLFGFVSSNNIQQIINQKRKLSIEGRMNIKTKKKNNQTNKRKNNMRTPNVTRILFVF